MLSRVVSVILFASSIVACGGGSSGSGSNSGASGGAGSVVSPIASPATPDSADLTSAKALFIENVASSASSASSVSSVGDASSFATTKKLRLLNALNQVEDVSFRGSDGRAIDVEVSNFQSINSDYSAVEIVSSYTYKRYLVRHSDGKLIDITNYQIGYAQIKDGYLYLRKENYALYKVNLSTLQATAVNNPNFNAISFSNSIPNTTNNSIYQAYLLDENLNVYLPTISGFYSPSILFASNVAPYLYDPNTDCLTPQLAIDFYSYTYGTNGKLYAYRVLNRNIGGWKTYHYLTEVNFTVTGTVCTDTLVRVFAPGDTNRGYSTAYDINDSNRYTVFYNGFAKMSPASDGSVSLSFTARDLSALTSTGTISGDYVYWKDGDSIYRMLISASSSPELMSTMSNILEFKVIGGAVLIRRYITGTDVGTYSVSAPGSTPVLIDSDAMDIDQLVEIPH